MSTSLTLVRAINESTRKNYDFSIKNDHLNFLEKCSDSLSIFFDSSLKEKLIFNALAYKSPFGTPFKIVGETSNFLGYKYSNYFTRELRNEVDKAMRNLVEAAKHRAKHTINLTNALLEKEEGFDLFFIQNTNDYSDIKSNTIACIDLASLEFDTNINSFCSKNISHIERFHNLFKNHEFSNEFTDPSQYGRYLWHYKNVSLIYQRYNPHHGFYVHFIRPSVNYWKYNLLLALATNTVLASDQLAFIDLVVYRIVSQTAIEQIAEVGKVTFSLTAHAFKTHLNTTLIPQVNIIKNTYTGDIKVKELENQARELFNYTGIISLIDKVDRKKDLIKSALKDGLINASPTKIYIMDELSQFTKRNSRLAKIELNGNAADLPFGIKFLNRYYFSLSLLRLFLNTLFENAIAYGRREKGKVIIRIDRVSEAELVFENEIRSYKQTIDIKKLKGNLRLFQDLLALTGSGAITISSKHYLFKLTLKDVEA